MGLIQPNTLSFVIVALALYGDLAKRLIASSTALFLLYAAAGTILLVMSIDGNKRRNQRPPLISTLAGFLIAVYFMQLSTSSSLYLMPAIMMATYVCIPLAFIFIIPRAYVRFDLHALALYTTILMIPIHLVGIIQQFANPSFMVSTVYSETGGIIARNFLEVGSHFNRLPSIFASADRYAGVSAMHVFLTFVLMAGGKAQTRMSLAWIILSLALASVGLLIAGARSRIIIVIVALIVAGAVFLTNFLRGRLTARALSNVRRAFVLVVLGFVVAMSIDEVKDRIVELPVLTMLGQTFEKGDVGSRFWQGIDLSLMPDDVTIFGEGLGVTGDGRPGEFGIRAMWIEGGLLWTTIMLIIHTAILFTFAHAVMRAAQIGDSLRALLLTGGGLYWLFGLLAGLSSTFELSLALLLFPMIAVSFPMRAQRRAKVPGFHSPGHLEARVE